MGWTKGAAHRMVDEDRAGRDDLADDIEDRAGHQSRNALAFNYVGYETNGLMAEGSVGHQQRQIDFSIFEFLRDGRSELGLNLLMLPDPAHNRNMIRRQFAYDSFCNQ